MLLAVTVLAAMGTAHAEPLPSNAHIEYDVLLGGALKVGRAEQDWKVVDGRYTLETRLTPLFGPKIRYISHGKMGKAGLIPEDFAEYRNDDEKPRISTRFDWASKQATLGPNDGNQVLEIEAGVQDVNAFVFQLAWLGDKSGARMQIATGRKLRIDGFASSESITTRLGERDVRAKVWKSQDSDSQTSVWLAPELGFLPLRVQRQDERAEIVLVARQISYDKSSDKSYDKTKNESKP